MSSTLPAESTHVESPLVARPTPPDSMRTAGVEVSEVSCDEEAAWDRCVARYRDATLFHNLAWRRAVQSVYGHAPHYLAARRRGRIVGVLPLFCVGNRLLGRSLISVPYGVGGGVLADDNEARRALCDASIALANRLGCASVQFRSQRANLPGVPLDDRYYGFRRVLPGSVAGLETFLPRKARACVRNARSKYGLKVHFGDDHLPTVWNLYALNMRRLASLAYPIRFFERLLDEHPGRHLVSVISRDDKPLAGLVTFMFRDTVYPYFYGACQDARRYGAAHLAYASLMEWAVRAGYRVFDFGRSRRGNAGSADFKRLCGFDPKPLSYQTYVVPGRKPVDLTPGNRKIHLIRRVWPMLPTRVTNAVSATLSKYIPG